MRSVDFLLLGSILLSNIGLHAQQKTFDWVRQSPDSYRIGPGYHSGVAVYKPQGWEAIHVRLDLAAREPVSVGVVRLEDWNNAIRNPGDLAKLDYACLTESVTRVSFSCNFYASSTARVVVVRDSRQTEHPVVTGIAAPQAPMTVALVPAPLADELYAHRDQASAILAKSDCKQYGIQASTFDCAFHARDGAMQVVLLPEVAVRKKKKAEVTISTLRCMAHCTNKPE